MSSSETTAGGEALPERTGSEIVEEAVAKTLAAEKTIARTVSDRATRSARAAAVQAADLDALHPYAAQAAAPTIHPEFTAIAQAAVGEPVSLATQAIAAMADTTRDVTTESRTAAEAELTPIKATMETTMTTAEDFMSFGQGNLEAFMKSGQIWAAGMQDLGKHVAESARAQMDQTMSTFKAIAGVRSFKEAVDLQSTLARASVEKAVADTGHLTDASMKLAEQSLAPIAARLSLAAEKFGKTAI